MASKTRRVCRNCKMIVEGHECPACKGTSFAENWQGRLFIADPTKSVIAQKIGITMPGEYAIKIKA